MPVWIKWAFYSHHPTKGEGASERLHFMQLVLRQVSVSRFRNSQVGQRAKQNPPFWGSRGIGVTVFELEASTYHLKFLEGPRLFLPVASTKY